MSRDPQFGEVDHSRVAMKYAALLEDFQEPIKRPRYFLILKYTLIAYLVLHVAYLIITLPFGLQDLEHSGHPHASELHLLWIISVIYCIIFSSIGLFAVYKVCLANCFELDQH